MNTTLVTGGAGFIGSHLVDALLAKGRNVVVIDDLSTGTLDNLAAHRQNERLAIYVESIENKRLLKALIADADEIYHLAAIVGVRLVLAKPERTMAVNHDATQYLLREAAELGRPTFLASTSEVYGKNPNMPLREDDDSIFGPVTKGRWIYAYTKAMDEHYALMLRQKAGFPVVIGRFFNTVGPRQSGEHGMVVPRFIDRALAGQPLEVHDDGLQIRCFCHVADTVRATLGLMATPEAYGSVFNIGNDQAIEILELAKHVAWIINPDVPIEHIPYAEAFGEDFEDIRCRVPDLRRLRLATGYVPSRTLDDIILDAIDWKKGRPLRPWSQQSMRNLKEHRTPL